LIGPHSFLIRELRNAALVLTRWSYRWLLRTFCAGVSCHLECGCGLVGTGAAGTEVAAKAAKPVSVGMITRLSASLVGGDSEAECGEPVIKG